MQQQVLHRRVAFVDDLARHGGRPALHAGGATVTYAELAARVAEAAAGLGSRRLQVLAPGHDVDSVVAYLAALRAGHPVLLAEPARLPDLADRYGDAGDLHPDLALLLSTSGSTGAPKLVRLSHENLASNAGSIADYLEIRTDDVAALALPLHYCYGLSVLHSHLLRGAAVVLGAWSVVHPGFWESFRRHGATSLAGVPHTFDLLDRVGFEAMDLPTLRTITQAGGRLAPERVRRYAALGRERGWRFFVMYGQTEATARMAYLPPELAETHPAAIGVAVPGGRLDLADAGDDGIGELVYEGPNVMLGYAETADDLALGRTVDLLRTGDLARRTPDGLFEVVGRRSRFVKPFGLRVDLEQVERLLGEHGVEASCAGDDRRLVVAVTAPGRVDEVRQVVAHHVGLPAWSVAVVAVDDLPRLASGKPDHAAVLALTPPPAEPGSVHELYAEVLGLDRVDDGETFTALGGDSLSYVELSIRLEALLGTLPPSWHETPVGDLVARAARRRALPRVETNVVLRALGIFLVVAGHTGLVELAGGAHVLLAVVGFNYARFQLRGRRQLASIGRIAVPAMVWIAAVVALTDRLGPANVALVHDLVGPSPGRDRWGYWFVEATVQLLLVLAALSAVPALRRLERARPWATPLALVLAGLALRHADLTLHHEPWPWFMPHNVLWLLALGWLAQRSTTTSQRVATSVLAVVATVGSFGGDLQREAVVALGVLALVWVPTIPVPAPLTRPLGLVAGASLWIYLTHWEVHRPLVERAGAGTATLASLVVGVAAWRLWSYASSRVPRRASSTSAPAPMSAA